MDKRFVRLMPEIGECIWYFRPHSVGKGELDTRWEQGVFAGLREEPGGLHVDKGALKVRDYKRKPEKNRWNQVEFAGVQGVS